MNTPSLEELKQHLSSLSADDLRSLSEFLESVYTRKVVRAGGLHNRARIGIDPQESREITDWLKVNCDLYQGQYVALDGSRLVGQGQTIREAHEAAKQRGCPGAFLVYVPLRNGEFIGGWM